MWAAQLLTKQISVHKLLGEVSDKRRQVAIFGVNAVRIFWRRNTPHFKYT